MVTRIYHSSMDTPKLPVLGPKLAHYMERDCSNCGESLLAFVWETDTGVYCSKGCAEQHSKDLVDLELMGHEDWRVRRVVAERINPDRLPEMMGDKHWRVRLEVARRIDPDLLSEMMGEQDWGVRIEVARRIPRKYLTSMLLKETNSTVIEMLHRRITKIIR